MLEPELLTLTLAPGQAVTETKFVTIPLPEKLDILFAYDLTGSMSSIIASAKARTVELIARLESLGIDIQYGVASYMDYPHAYTSFGYSDTYGIEGDYAYRLDQPITGDTTSVLNAINALVLGSGADTPQDYTRIMYESYSDPNVAWREGARRILLNFADSVPHDNNLNEGVPGKVGIRSTGGDPGRDEIMFTPDDLDLQTVLAEMAENEVTLIEAHATTLDIEYWEHWTGITGGQTFMITSATFVDDVFNAITSTLSSVTGLTLVAEEGFEDWVVSVTPESFTGTATEPIEFKLRLRVPPDTADGFYTFTISAVDAFDTVYGVQTVEIEVVTVRSAGSLDVEYIQAYNIHDDGECVGYFVYPVRYIIGTLYVDNGLAAGVYHTLINIQNNVPFKNSIKVLVSVAAAPGCDAFVTRYFHFKIEPFEALQLSGDDIRELLASTPHASAPFLSGTVLIIDEKGNLGVSAAYTFYQNIFVV